MSKNNLHLKSAIQGLNINKPYDLRAQIKPALKAPVQIEQVQKQHAESEDVQIEAAQKREAPQGFFMLAHSVFEDEVIRNLSGDAFRIFIWMSAQAWRFKESKGEFRGAVDYISLKCGCSRSTVTRGLQDLKANKLIVCIEQNFKKGNLWGVSRIADGRKDAEIEASHNEETKIGVAQNRGEACSKSGGSVLNLTKEHAHNEHHLINPNKKLNKSEEAAGEIFEALEERKMMWKKFTEAFPNEIDRECKIRDQLQGLPFPPTQEFARDLAVMKWWESQFLF